jgi:hypothetical protein
MSCYINVKRKYSHDEFLDRDLLKMTYLYVVSLLRVSTIDKNS